MTSEIEGEQLDVASVRRSIARRLGVGRWGSRRWMRVGQPAAHPGRSRRSLVRDPASGSCALAITAVRREREKRINATIHWANRMCRLGTSRLDAIFGERNFVATCIWHKNYSPKPSARFFSEDHDYLLVYAKNKNQWRPNLLERTLAVDLDRVLTGDALPGFAQLGALLFHMAANEAIDPATVLEQDGHGYLGESSAFHVWLFYKPNMDFLKSRDSALTLAKAKALSESRPGKKHLVFAPAKFVSQKMLDEAGEAKARGDFLILLVQAKPTDRPRTEKGVSHCGTELDALALKASMLPSQRGNKSLLSDVLQDVAGKVIRPVPCKERASGRG